jgi:hypothetical protein
VLAWQVLYHYSPPLNSELEEVVQFKVSIALMFEDAAEASLLPESMVLPEDLPLFFNTGSIRTK